MDCLSIRIPNNRYHNRLNYEYKIELVVQVNKTKDYEIILPQFLINGVVVKIDSSIQKPHYCIVFFKANIPINGVYEFKNNEYCSLLQWEESRQTTQSDLKLQTTSLEDNLAAVCANVQYKNNCDDEVWNLVNSLYGSSKADSIIKYMNADCDNCKHYSEDNECCLDHCMVREPLSYKPKQNEDE